MKTKMYMVLPNRLCTAPASHTSGRFQKTLATSDMVMCFRLIVPDFGDITIAASSLF